MALHTWASLETWMSSIPNSRVVKDEAGLVCVCELMGRAIPRTMSCTQDVFGPVEARCVREECYVQPYCIKTRAPVDDLTHLGSQKGECFL